MNNTSELAERIRSAGFACTSCGACCQCSGGDDWVVHLTPPEIRSIMALTGLGWDEVAVPYPETLEGGPGTRYTLGWSLKMTNGRCRFLVNGRCAVYDARPWICRTYPFMLDAERLVISECGGTGSPLPESAALQIARDLIARQSAEEEEGRRIRKILQEEPIPKGRFCVIDSEGVKVCNG